MPTEPSGPPPPDESSGNVTGGDPGATGPFAVVLERLERIEETLAVLVRQRAVKDWYSTDEVAQLLDKAPFTVRQWCRQGRVRARKRPCGRGLSAEWMIAHEEVLRVQNEGLLPLHDA